MTINKPYATNITNIINIINIINISNIISIIKKGVFMNKLINFNNNDLGKLTLEEIQKNADKVEITQNTIKIQKQIRNEILTIQINSYPDGNFTTLGKVEIPERKSDYTETVLMMLSQGYKQKDIAFTLGISQTLVSRIKNNAK